MDSWPSSQCDGPHPQDAAVHSMAGAIDLSRRHREALVNAGATETLTGAPGSDRVGGVPTGDCRDSPPLLVWPADRTELHPEVPDGLVRTKGEAEGGACFAQLGHGKSATASQWGGQRAERQNGSMHPRQWDGCAAGSWGRGLCSAGAPGRATMQACYAVNGGHPYGTGGALCTAAVSLGAREAPSVRPQPPTGENPIGTVPDAPTTEPAAEESGGSAASAGQERPRRDCGDEGSVTEPYRASPKPGASPWDNDGAWGSHLHTADDRRSKEAELSTCLLRTVKSKVRPNVTPPSGGQAANPHPPEQHGGLDGEASKTPVSLKSGMCEAGAVQASSETPTRSGGQQGTEVAGDCRVVLPRIRSPPVQPSLTPTRLESGLPDTSPPSGSERDEPGSPGATRAGRGGIAKRAASGRVAARKPRSARRGPGSVKVGHSSLFGPREPEITLRYASHKVERRYLADAFAPYVHLERGEFSVCAVVNSPEEERARLQEGPPQPDSQFSPSAVPTSSCLLLGRLAAGSGPRPGSLCCLCHRGSNDLELGDLHGPYRPSQAGPARLPPSTPHVPEEDESNQSDSSCSLQGGALKRGSPSEAADGQLSDRDGCLTPPAKRPKEDECRLDVREYWIHEDCGIWSPGVFLVRGKLYGLEEAIRFGRETLCSLCHQDGATLGCFFKTCPSKFHYTCAVQADCVLNEENFSMKCPTHKNRPVKGLAQPERR